MYRTRRLIGLSYVRLLAAALVAVCGAALLDAQIPGRNVNMVSGRALPGGDPYLQRQNEPSVAASTRNPLHLLAGANDYRTVDLPGLPNSNETGDAWMGVFKSYDGGNTWRSSLIPGFPQDNVGPGSTSPLRAYKAAADPVVRAGTNGLFYYTGIVFDRSSPSKSAMFVSRFIDNNNQEAGDPIVFLDTKLIATNDGSAFIDKPWFVVDIPRANAQTCTITTSQKSPTADDPDRMIQTTQSFPAGAAYAAFSMITGEATSTKSQVYLSRSTDCGQTWSTPLQISANVDPINQGATLAIDPRDGTVYIAWRRFTSDGTDDSIMVARSRDQGRKWDPPGKARRFPRGNKKGLTKEVHGKKYTQPVELADLSSLDQPTRPDPTLHFRTNAYPTMTVDGDGRVYVAWAERGFAPNPDPDEGDARILVTTSTDGAAWSGPTPVDNSAVAGHQIMPTLTFAGGKLMLAYYDFREDVSGVFRKFVDEASAVTLARRRHTVDVRAAMASPGPSPTFGESVRVSEYLMGSRPGSGPRPVEQLQYNPPNLKLFQLGTVPFVGDYIDLTPSPAFVPNGSGGWQYNTAPSSSPLFHVVWTDNRDVVPPADGDWTKYTPPGSTGGTSTYDGVTPIQACAPGREGMRNQNIYTARLTGGLVAGSPGNAKPLSPTLPRAFVIYAQNATEVTRTFRLTIVNQPVGGRASFLQTPLPPYDASTPAPLTVLDVMVPRRSTIARNVYATSSNPDAQIDIAVREVTGVAGDIVTGGLQSTVILNPDISNPDISNPDISNPDISNPDISNPDISNAEVSNPDISNPDISNPDISNPDISNPDISNPDISNPDISNVQVANPDISNPDISNPDISNPDISNPDISNPDISNPDISNQSLTDTTWTVTNEGNTASSYSIKLLLNGVEPSPDQIALQLILRKVYTTPVAVNCELGLHAHNILLANILNPSFASTPAEVENPDISNPDISNATLWLAPGETAKVTLRVRDLDTTDSVTFDAVEAVTPAVVSQGLNVALVNGQLVVSTAEPIAFPPTNSQNLRLQFGNLPALVQPGAPVGVVTVDVTDPNNAPVPGATVYMSLHSDPGDAQVSPTVGTTSDTNGTAAFNLGALPAGLYRVRFRVEAPGYPAVVGYSTITTFTAGGQLLVTSTASSGAGSLHQAILDSNATQRTVESIAFALGGAPVTIDLTAPLPAITAPVTIDGGATAGCSAADPLVALSGALLTNPGPGLLITSANVTVRNLVMTRFNGNGIELRGGGNSRIECSRIGTGHDGYVTVIGNTSLGNTGNGIQLVDSPGNVIGGTGNARNVVSNNGGEGIRVDGAGAFSNIIEGNLVGATTVDGEPAGNSASGIYIRRAPGNTIRGNTVADSRGFAGIAVCGNLTFCGGGDIGTQTSNAAGTIIQGNYVGVDAAGNFGLQNFGFGISLDGVSGTLVGGPSANHTNVIAYNRSSAVVVFGAGAQGNKVTRNSIYGNASGIDLGNDGVTPNDAGDVDTGPNLLQNTPVISSATTQGSQTSISGSIDGDPNTLYTIEIFASPACGTVAEGQDWFTTITVQQGGLSFATATLGALPAGTGITATATDPAGNTSEFSTCVAVTASTQPTAVGPVGGSGGNAFSFSCPANSSGTAFRGRSGDDIDRTELWCTPATGGQAVLAGGVGGTGGGDYGTALTCGTGAVITGIHGRQGIVTWGGHVIDTLGVTCTSPAAQVSLGPVGNSAGAAPFTLSCPAGQKVVGIFGKQGGLLDSIGIYCQ